MGYLMVNTVPYAPFMAVDMLPERATSENVGKYSAFFSSCFIWGRSSGAGAWGRLADTKGRMPVIQVSLVFGAIFSVLFGMSNSYLMALAMRFMMGLFCDLVSIVKTCVSELAGDDRNLEAASMNLVISVFAVATLLSPAIGGGLADPVKQYHDLTSTYLQNTPLLPFLTTYRYILPNVVGAILCLFGLLVTRLHLTETLAISKSNQSESNRLQEDRLQGGQSENDSLLASSKNNTAKSRVGSLYLEDSFALSPEAFEVAYEDDVNDSIRDSYLFSDDLEGVMTTAQTRKSRAVSIVRCSTISYATKQRISKRITMKELPELPEEPDKGEGSKDEAGSPPTTLTLLKDTDTRNHLLVYCIGCFVICFHMEAFPLFCLSHNAGLGVSEGTIGGIMLASGITHALLQPRIYGCIFAATGLRGSIKWASLGIIPVFFLLPFALLSKGVGEDHLRWTALSFLGVVVGLGRTFTVTFYSSISVSLNHLVAPEHRATFNGLLTRISGGCKGAAPIMAGFFVSWAFTSGVVPANGWGAVLLYGSLALVGILLSGASFLLLGPDDHFFD